jgi:transglutaminase-like putative cysteine protease
VSQWLSSIRQGEEAMETYTLLQHLCDSIHASLTYVRREEPGVQTGAETLDRGAGSCRDFAALFMAAARQLGFAARFVSGYLHTPPSTDDFGSTHAWAEVYLPGAGWTGFDPTLGTLAGTDHIAVAVARRPEAVPPVAGSFVGAPGARLSVGVWVSRL